MGKVYTFILLFFLGGHDLMAQKYGTTLGLRLGNDRYRTIGLTLQQRVLKYMTIEGILQSDLTRNTTSHGLIKHHLPLITRRLNVFTGAGVSLGDEESISEEPVSQEVITTYGNKTIGLDLMVGAELTLLGLNVSLDYKPNINLVGRENWYQGQVGISVRTVLIRDIELKKKKRRKAREKRRQERAEARARDN